MSTEPNNNGNTPPDGGDPAGQSQQGDGNQQPALTWDTWLADQSDEVKALAETANAGLKTALQSERDARKQLDAQLKKLSKSAGDNAELTQTIEDLRTQLEGQTRKANFATDLGNSVTDVELAFIAAERIGAFDRDGRVNVEKLKAAHPALFNKQPAAPPPGNHANGSGNPGGAGTDINALIRGHRYQ